MIESVYIVNRKNIPVLTEVTTPEGVVNIGALYDFRAHPTLKNLMPTELHFSSFAWTSLESHQTLPEHKHPVDSMILICGGTGRYFGKFDADIEEGDVIYVQSNALHGFQAGEGGMRCLSIQFEPRGLYEDPEHSLVKFGTSSNYDQLLKLNNSWAKKYKALCISLEMELQQHGDLYINALFSMLSRWSVVFQHILYLRQALSTDGELYDIFKEHLIEEFGHDRLLADQTYQWDAQAEACFSWFVGQMYTLCDVRKLILVNMVLETAGEIFSLHSKDVSMKSKLTADYVKLHHHLDKDHAEVGSGLIQQYCFHNYEKAHDICNQSWSIFFEMFAYFMKKAQEAASSESKLLIEPISIKKRKNTKI